MQQIPPTMWRGKKTWASMDKSETPRPRLARHAASVGPGQAPAMHGSAAAEITPPSCLSLCPIIACNTVGLGLLTRHLAAPSLVSPLRRVCYDRHAPARTTRMPRPPPCAHRMSVFDQASQFKLTRCWLMRRGRLQPRPQAVPAQAPAPTGIDRYLACACLVYIHSPHRPTKAHACCLTMP